VKAFDPAAMEEAKRVLPGIEFGKDAYDVARAGCFGPGNRVESIPAFGSATDQRVAEDPGLH